jgi:hypothetical protein
MRQNLAMHIILLTHHTIPNAPTGTFLKAVVSRNPSENRLKLFD